MDTTVIHCGHCGAVVDPPSAGHRVTCAHCGRVTILPGHRHETRSTTGVRMEVSPVRIYFG